MIVREARPDEHRIWAEMLARLHADQGVAEFESEIAALIAAVEEWARSEGLDWLGSDTTPDNQLSRDWHRQMGFEEVEQLIVFGKSLQG